MAIIYPTRTVSQVAVGNVPAGTSRNTVLASDIDTDTISGVIVRKTIPQGIVRIEESVETIIAAAPNDTLNIRVGETPYGHIPGTLRVFIDGHETQEEDLTANPPVQGYTISNGVITPPAVLHPRTYSERHSPRAFRTLLSAPESLIIIDQRLPSVITTELNGTLLSITLTNTGGTRTPQTLAQPIISTWTADLSTIAGGGSGTGLFENAETVEVGSDGGDDGYIVTYRASGNETAAQIASGVVSDTYFPPSSSTLVLSTYSSAATTIDELVRADFEAFTDGDSVDVRPTNVTATLNIVRTNDPDSQIILLKNGPKGGFSQEFGLGTLRSGETLSVNDVVEAVLTRDR